MTIAKKAFIISLKNFYVGKIQNNRNFHSNQYCKSQFYQRVSTDILFRFLFIYDLFFYLPVYLLICFIKTISKTLLNPKRVYSYFLLKVSAVKQASSFVEHFIFLTAKLSWTRGYVLKHQAMLGLLGILFVSYLIVLLCLTDFKLCYHVNVINVN